MKEYVKPVSIVYVVHSISCFCNSEGNLHPPEEGEQLSKEAFWDDWSDDDGW